MGAVVSAEWFRALQTAPSSNSRLSRLRRGEKHDLMFELSIQFGLQRGRGRAGAESSVKPFGRSL